MTPQPFPRHGSWKQPFLCFGVALVLLTPLQVAAQGTGARAPKEARGALDTFVLDAAKRLDAVESYYLDAFTTLTVSAQGRSQASSMRASIWFNKPNKVYMVLQGSKMLTVVVDGQNAMYYLPQDKIYTVEPLSAGTRNGADSIATYLMGFGAFPSSLLYSPRLRMGMLMFFGSDGDQALQDAGKTQFAGRPAHRYVLGVQPGQAEVWLTEDAHRLPFYVVNTGSRNGRVIRSDTYLHWVMGKVPESSFVIKEPTDARKVPMAQMETSLKVFLP